MNDAIQSDVRASACRQRCLQYGFGGIDRASAPERGYRSGVVELRWATVLAAEVAMFGGHFGRRGRDYFQRCCGLYMTALGSFLQLH